MAILDTTEFRLVLTIALNAAVIASCLQLIRALCPRQNRTQRAIDLILLWSATSSTIVATLGWLGALNLPALIVATFAVAAGVGVLARAFQKQNEQDAVSRAEPCVQPDSGRSPSATVLITVLACGFVVGHIGIARNAPAAATDALIYHLALPARWIQDGQIDVIPLWFHNPANSYSPLHGSCLFAWLMLPMGNDLLARFGQFPHLALCALCIYRMLARAGVADFVAAAVGIAFCLTRSLFGEATQPKDDVILTGYFLAAIAASDREGLATRIGAIRLGLATGLMLATKYTAILALPAIALAALPTMGSRDARRRLAWSLLPVVLLAGPWYLRNLITTGNPVFPIDVRIGSWSILPGVFATTVAPEDRTLASLAGVLFGTGRFTMRWWLMPGLIVGWLPAWFVCRRRWRDSTVVACLLGPPLLLIVFYLVSPYREVRFLFPAIGLLFTAAGLAIGSLPGPRWLGWILAGTLLTASGSTALPRLVLAEVMRSAIGLTAIVILGRFVWLRWMRSVQRARYALAIAAGVLAFGFVYVCWDVYVEQCRQDYGGFWAASYRDNGLGQAWAWLDQHTGPDDVVAWTGTPMCYPLLGFDLKRRAEYVPIQPGVDGFGDLPRIDEPLSGGQIVPRTIETYRGQPDRAYWRERLTRTRARYLLTTPLGKRQPIEQTWAERDGAFRTVFRFGATAVYAINAE